MASEKSDPRRPTRTKVLELKQAGLDGMAIARVLGLTHQRVYQHIRALKKDGLLPEEEAAS